MNKTELVSAVAKESGSSESLERKILQKGKKGDIIKKKIKKGEKMNQIMYGNFFPGQWIIEQRAENTEGDGLGYVFELISRSQCGKCPKCGVKSERYHSVQV